MNEEEQKKEIRSIQELQAEFDKVFLMADRGVIPLVCAVIIANQMENDPVWLLIISPPSGGKTEIIQSLESININPSASEPKPLCFPISDLTVNTFASGQKKIGKETSLLHKMLPGSIMTFKDFTSMISKNHDAQQEIMAQLREIYDQYYVKRTGTGDDVEWRGKVGAIAGCTEVIYETNENFASMGDRFIMYNMIQPDRMDVLERVISGMSDKDKKFKQKKVNLKESMKSFMEYNFQNIENTELDLEPNSKKDILEVVNFVTMVSSGVITDKKKGTVEFVPSTTMPMRMAKQILCIAQAFVLMNKNVPGLGVDSPLNKGALTQEQIHVLYKICLDTIPKKRRMALQQLAKYKLGATTAGIATALGYQTTVVSGWMAQLNALGICKREKTGRGDKWYLNDKYRDILVQFENIQTVDGELDSDGEEDGMGYEGSWYKKRDHYTASLNPAGSYSAQKKSTYNDPNMESDDPIGDSEYEEEMSQKAFEEFGKLPTDDKPTV